MNTLIKSVVWNVFAQTLQRDRKRPELISSVANTFNDVPVAQSIYEHDKISRRTQRLDYSGVSVVTNTFTYNCRSEVAGMNLNTVEYAYAYDNIGNHTTPTGDSVSISTPRIILTNIPRFPCLLCRPWKTSPTIWTVTC